MEKGESRWTSGNPGHAVMTETLRQREPCFQLLPQKLAPEPWRRASVPRTVRAKPELGRFEQVQRGSSRR